MVAVEDVNTNEPHRVRATFPNGLLEFTVLNEADAQRAMQRISELLEGREDVEWSRHSLKVRGSV